MLIKATTELTKEVAEAGLEPARSKAFIIAKPRIKPIALKLFKILLSRKKLSEEEKKNYYKMERGYEGEVMFDQLIEKNLKRNFIILNDLLFKFNGSHFQIDSIMISQVKIHLIEVKNLKGNYLFKENKFICLDTNEEYQNPLDQLRKTELLLRQSLQKMSISIPIETHLVFINPEFTLYNAPLHEPIIFPTQLMQFMQKLNSTPCKLNSKHTKLAEMLLAAHITDSPFNNLPAYSYDELKLGNTCSLCNSFSVMARGQKLICHVCLHEEPIDAAVLRSVGEIRALFPETRITRRVVYEWCSVVKSQKTISRILRKNFKKIGFGQWTYYE